MSKRIPVVEFFGPTIQGEGAMIGVQTTFIRFGLCDYECKLCDSMFAVDPHKVKANATWLTPEEIVMKIGDNRGCEWITFSGGNPCIHDLKYLVDSLREKGIKIAVETQGTFKPSWLHQCDVVTVSPKPPSMGEKYEPGKFEEFIKEFSNHLGLAIKVPIFGVEDFDMLDDVNYRASLLMLDDVVYISLGNPMPPGKLDIEPTLKEFRNQMLDHFERITTGILNDSRFQNVKILPQLHVLVWGNRQGV
jgi:7-carboxy-7-deazaguanine synthase